MSASFSTAVYIEAPPAVVFEALTNLDAAGQWMEGLVGIEKLTPGPFRVGTEFRETRKVAGRQATEHYKVTRADPPSRIDLLVDGAKGSSKRGEYAFVFEVVPERTGSNVEMTADIRMPGVWSLLSRFMVGSFRKACHRELEALKKHLESPWPASPRH